MDVINEKQQRVREINDEWLGDESEDGTIAGDYGKEGWDFYMYEPFAFERDDGSEYVPYWEETRKIVFCNLNAFGDYPKYEYHTFTWDIFKKNIDHDTLLHTALFCYCLRKRLAGEPLPSVNGSSQPFKSIFDRERSQIEDAMQRVCYMNIDKLIHTSSDWTAHKPGEKSPCDWTWDFYKDSPSASFNREYQRKQIAALEPDIFIITGIGGEKEWTGGFDLLNRIYEHDNSDVPEENRYIGEELWLDRPNQDNDYITFKTLGKTLFVSIKHPSRFSWEYIVDTVEKIKENVSG
jgi:hypothetical protein